MAWSRFAKDVRSHMTSPKPHSPWVVGARPIYAAVENPNPEVVSVLSKAGADVNAKDKDGWTALMAAAAKNPEPGVVSALLEAGADIQGKNDAGWTALMAAAHNSNPDVTATLLEAGANVHERNRSGRTALMEARENGNPRARKAIVKLLKRAEAGEQPFYGSKDEKGR